MAVPPPAKRHCFAPLWNPDQAQHVNFSDITDDCLTIASDTGHLEITDCYIKKIAKFPDGLRTLWISNCYNITELPALPPSITNLTLYNIPQLKSLPDMPTSLRWLHLLDLPSLTRMGKLAHENCAYCMCGFDPEGEVQSIVARCELYSAQTSMSRDIIDIIEDYLDILRAEDIQLPVIE